MFMREIKVRYIWVAILVVFLAGYLYSWGTLHVDLSKVANLDRTWYGAVETMESTCTVETMGISSGGHATPMRLFRNIYRVGIRLDENDIIVYVKIGKDKYNTTSIGQTGVLIRRVYYTWTGLRLCYADCLVLDQ